MKHTPGPWFVENNNIRCHAQEDDTGTFIAEMQSSVAPDTTKANARLIAAAPDLLEALHDALMAFGAVNNGEFDFPDDIQAIIETADESIQSAIAKAEGR